MTVDVVVCGAGVAGLLCANALGARGFRVLLLERRHEPVALAKGEVFQPGSIAILRALGLLRGLEERGAVSMDRLVVHGGDGEELMAFDYSDLPGRERSMLSLDYHEILSALGEALPASVSFRRDATVHELLREPTGRVAGVGFSVGGHRETVHAPLVVAADGVSSRLRKLAEIPVRRVEYQHRLVSFELSGVRGSVPEVSAHMTSDGLRLFYPLPGDRVRLYVQAAPATLRTMNRASFNSWCSTVCDDSIRLASLKEPLQHALGTRQTHTLWRFNASRLTVPGLALVGESAHSVHPMAAQGMNTAVADAYTLAELLAHGPLTSARMDVALATYESQRRTWIRHVDLMSHDATRMITSTSRVGRLLGAHLLRRTGRNPRLRHIGTYNLAGYGMRPFTVLDRLHQAILPDPRADRATTTKR